MPFRQFFNSPPFFVFFLKCLFLSNLSTAYFRIKIDPLKTILENFCTVYFPISFKFLYEKHLN